MGRKAEFIETKKDKDIYLFDNGKLSFEVRIPSKTAYSNPMGVASDYAGMDSDGSFVTIEVTNKTTGKKNKKRMYQTYDEIIEDLEHDFFGDRKIYSWWKKIIVSFE